MPLGWLQGVALQPHQGSLPGLLGWLVAKALTRLDRLDRLDRLRAGLKATALAPGEAKVNILFLK